MTTRRLWRKVVEPNGYRRRHRWLNFNYDTFTSLDLSRTP